MAFHVEDHGKVQRGNNSHDQEKQQAESEATAVHGEMEWLRALLMVFLVIEE